MSNSIRIGEEPKYSTGGSYMEKNDSGSITLQMGGNDRIFLGRTDAQKLIKALQKAIELGWCDE